MRLITKRCRAFSGSSYNATARSPERQRRARRPLSGTVLLQKRNMKRNRRTEGMSGGTIQGISTPRESEESPLRGHRTPYYPWVVWNLGGRARPRNLFARFPPCFKNTSRGTLRLSSKAVPEKEAEGLGAAAQENGTGAERLPTAGSGTEYGKQSHKGIIRI